MGSICLSSASILRCDSLTRNQNIYLIIPTALEVIFSTSLVLINRGPGKRNLLLTAEGLFFLLLVVLELLSQILPAVRGNLHLFKAFDLIIAIASFLPICLYTLFLYLFTNAELLSVLPRRMKTIAKLALILSIPVIITFNEIASFIGITIRNIPTDKAPETVIAIGFAGSTQQGLWTFFTSVTLAVLTGFQAASFSFAFFRLTQAIHGQRKFENQRNGKAHLIKGIGWISGSLKLGALETVIGFAGGGFGVVLTRRILRLLARASLCIGVVKGVDAAGFRGSKLRDFISNPRLSTFRQLSPKATTFHAAQQASDIHEKSPAHTTLTPGGLPGMAHFANVRAQNGRQRVTVRYDQGTPLLHIRLSMLDIPSPSTMVKEIKKRPVSECDAQLAPPRPSFQQLAPTVVRDSTDSATSFAGPFELVTIPRRMLSQRSARAKLYQASAMSGESPNSDPTTVESQDLDRVQSVRSIPDSLQAVHDLAAQFPGTPQDRNAFNNLSEWDEVPPIPQAFGSPSNYVFEGQPSRKGNIVLSGDSAWSGNSSSAVALSDNRSIRSSRQPTLYNVTGTPIKSAPSYSEKPIDPFNDTDEEDARPPAAADKKSSSASVPGFNRSHDPKAGTADMATALDTRKARQSRPRKLQSSRQEYLDIDKGDEKATRTAEWIGSSTGRLQAETPAKLLQDSQERATNLDHLAIPWLKRPEEDDRRFFKGSLAKVKNVGKVPRKFTPLPTQAGPERASRHLKPIIIPPRGKNMPEIDQTEYGSLESTVLGMRDDAV